MTINKCFKCGTKTIPAVMNMTHCPEHGYININEELIINKDHFIEKVLIKINKKVKKLTICPKGETKNINVILVEDLQEIMLKL